MILACVLIVIVSYLLGSIPSGYVLVRIFRHQDIRQTGSGNIGATNVLRTGSKGLAAATFLMDMLKGCAAVWLGGLIGYLLAPAAAPDNMRGLAALFAVLGHIFPVWLGFKGGKGVSTGFGVFLVAAPWAALAAIAVFFIVLALIRYVSLASILGAASFPFFAWWMGYGGRLPFFTAVQITVALLLIARHHQNIRRLLNGTESKLGVKKTA